ncbi:MAG: hypothetical protein KF860_16390 [Cyclobacteriaceae bacterium]|nr:hypothetical protein [Cyclobacteriaceae bacterium]
MKYIITVFIGLCLLSCTPEEEATIRCVGLWEIELLHSGATAEVVDGVLRLRVTNPQTDHDIRLIRRQTEYNRPGHIGVTMPFENMNNEFTGSKGSDMQLKAWYAYNYAPDDELASLSMGKFGARGTANHVTYPLYSNDKPTSGTLKFGGADTSVTFGAGGIGAVPVPPILSDPKTLYIDFGVRKTTIGTGETTYIEVDITEITFATGVGITGKDEMINDYFDCNSLKD